MQYVSYIQVLHILPADHIDLLVPVCIQISQHSKAASGCPVQLWKIVVDDGSLHVHPPFCWSTIPASMTFALYSLVFTVPRGMFSSPAISSYA